jgi:DNA repair protein RadD
MDYKRGEIRALTNANVLTTGFDAPSIDLIAMLRATLSPGLYVQMAGRGLRIAEGKADCLVLDFAGVVQTHGPITAVEPTGRASTQEADKMPPVKECPECGELVAPAVRVCPACQYAFPAPERKPLVLRQDDIMGLDPLTMRVQTWQWREHTSRSSGKEMIKVTYYGALSDPPVTEYFPIWHEGYAGEKAMRLLSRIMQDAGILKRQDDLKNELLHLNASAPPHQIEYRKDGKFYRVTARHFAGTADVDRGPAAFNRATG